MMYLKEHAYCEMGEKCGIFIRKNLTKYSAGVGVSCRRPLFVRHSNIEGSKRLGKSQARLVGYLQHFHSPRR